MVTMSKCIVLALLCGLAVPGVVCKGSPEAVAVLKPENAKLPYHPFGPAVISPHTTSHTPSPGPSTTSPEFLDIVKNTHDLAAAVAGDGSGAAKQGGRKLQSYTISSSCNNCGFNQVTSPYVTNDIIPRAVVLLYINEVNAAGARRTITCSGSLVASKYILTAGHCVVDGGGASTGYHFSSGTAYFRVVNNVASEGANICGYAYFTAWGNSNARTYDVALVSLCNAVTDTVPLVARVSASEGTCLLHDDAEAVGYPQGYRNTFNSLFSAYGIGTSFKPQSWFCDGSQMVTSSTDIYPGMSGGPLMLLETPRIIGINEAICTVNGVGTCPNAFTPITSNTFPALFGVFGATPPATN